MNAKKMAVSSFHVKDIMTAPVRTLSMDMTVRKAIEFLVNNEISGAPLVDNKTGKPITVCSEADLMKFAAMDGLDKYVVEFLDKLPTQLFKVKPNDTFAEVFKAFLTRPVRRVLVVDDQGKLQGVVSRRDIIKSFLADKTQSE